MASPTKARVAVTVGLAQSQEDFQVFQAEMERAPVSWFLFSVFSVKQQMRLSKKGTRGDEKS